MSNDARHRDIAALSASGVIRVKRQPLAAKTSSEGVKLVLPEPDSFVDWDPRLPPPGNIVELQYKGFLFFRLARRA